MARGLSWRRQGGGRLVAGPPMYICATQQGRRGSGQAWRLPAFHPPVQDRL